MRRLLFVLVGLVPVGFAPAPMLFDKPSSDNSERVLASFERDVREANPSRREVIAARKNALLAILERRYFELVRRGRDADADALYERLTLLETVDADRPLGKASTRSILQGASGKGKYRHLLRVVYVPTDEGSGDYQDYGFWAGTSYGGATDLPPGYWVYVAPRWFVWHEPVGKEQ